MKKVILAIALAAGIFTATTIQAANTVNQKTNMEVTVENDGFKDVKFEQLNEKVQVAIRALIEDYDINALKYNAEKQITKVEITNKADQAKATLYFDNEGVPTTWNEPVKEEDTKKEEKSEESTL
ncbi:MAG: hypothetical protein GX102_07570 [Porphyromonadaceae bacterium]|jgi:hypothetical protein|nr:hypothetical protein [Porphyromonadaceae bacterium]